MGWGGIVDLSVDFVDLLSTQSTYLYTGYAQDHPSSKKDDRPCSSFIEP